MAAVLASQLCCAAAAATRPAANLLLAARNQPTDPLSAAVFDGHGGFAAAEYLQQNLYKIFTRVLDQKGVQSNLEMSQDMPGEPLHGAGPGASPAGCRPHAGGQACKGESWL